MDSVRARVYPDSRSAITRRLFEREFMVIERESSILRFATRRDAFLARTFSKRARKKCIVSAGRYCIVHYRKIKIQLHEAIIFMMFFDRIGGGIYRALE